MRSNGIMAKSSSTNSALAFAGAAVAGAVGASAVHFLFAWWKKGRRWRMLLRCRPHILACESPDLEKMVAGEKYTVPPHSALMRMLVNAHELCEEFNARGRTLEDRKVILSGLFGTCHPSAYVEPPLYLDYGFNTHVGENFYANFGCVLLDSAPITIGKNCFLAPYVKLFTAYHPTNPFDRREHEFASPISIGDDCWFGGGATVCPGVKIGSRVVVAAGAVVIRDVPDDVIVAGVPAKIVRRFENR